MPSKPTSTPTPAQANYEPATWPITRIIRSEEERVLVDWEGVDERGKLWEPSWIPHTNLIDTVANSDQPVKREKKDKPTKVGLGAGSRSSTEKSSRGSQARDQNGRFVNKADGEAKKGKREKGGSKSKSKGVVVKQEETDSGSSATSLGFSSTSTFTRASSLTTTSEDLKPTPLLLPVYLPPLPLLIPTLVSAPPPPASSTTSAPNPLPLPSSPFYPLTFSSPPRSLRLTTNRENTCTLTNGAGG